MNIISILYIITRNIIIKYVMYIHTIFDRYYNIILFYTLQSTNPHAVILNGTRAITKHFNNRYIAKSILYLINY